MRRSLRSLFIASLIALALIFHQPFRCAVLTVLRFPFVVAKTGVRMVILVPRLPSLASENARLQSELMQYRIDAAQWREQARHVRAAQQLNQVGVLRQQHVVASVIGRSILPGQQTVLLDRGHRDGLSLESLVLNAAGVIGRVSEVHPATALVLLLTDTDSRIAAMIERSRETGLLIGQGYGPCLLIDLSLDADLQVGDRVVSAGFGTVFPKGLPLGTVTRVSRDEILGSSSALIEPVARLGQLEEVLVVTGNSEP